MNPVVRIALLVGALLAVVIAGSYYYSRSLEPASGAAAAPAGGPAAAPGIDVLVGQEVNEHLSQGLAALKDNRLEDARASLEQVPDDDAGYLIALSNLAHVRAKLEDFAGARDAIERLHSMQLETQDTVALLAEVQYRLGDFNGAELSILRAIEIDDSKAVLRYELALFRVAQGQLPEALATYERAIASDPSRDAIGTALDQLSALHEAHPELPSVHYALAYFGRRLSQPDLEHEELQHFVALETNSQAADNARKRLAELDKVPAD
jgi:tetratricopeptide (TPR) repeat protein